MLPFNYHHLYYFYVLAREGSVLKASEKLRLAQSTISTQIKQFESYWGRPLFERHAQGMILTEDGKTMMDYAETIFEIGRELSDTMTDQPIGGRLSIEVGVENGTPRSFTFALIMDVLTYDPSAHISVQEGDIDALLEKLNQQQIDLIFTNHPVQSALKGEYTNRLRGKVPIVFAAAPAIANRYRKLPESLNGAPFILPLAPNQLYQQIQDFFASNGIIPQIVAEVQDVEVARRLAVAEMGIAPLNAYTFSSIETPKALSILGRRRLPAMYETLYLVSRRRRKPNPLAKHLEQNFNIPETSWKSLNLQRL